jgi:hypothetical protein
VFISVQRGGAGLGIRGRNPFIGFEDRRIEGIMSGGTAA